MTDFKAKMHQIRFRLGSAPDPAGGANSAPPDPIAGLRGPTSKGRGGEGRGGGKMGRGRDVRGEEGRGGEEGRREGEGRPPNVRDALTPLVGRH